MHARTQPHYPRTLLWARSDRASLPCARSERPSACETMRLVECPLSGGDRAGLSLAAHHRRRQRIGGPAGAARPAPRSPRTMRGATSLANPVGDGFRPWWPFDKLVFAVLRGKRDMKPRAQGKTARAVCVANHARAAFSGCFLGLPRPHYRGLGTTSQAVILRLRALPTNARPAPRLGLERRRLIQRPPRRIRRSPRRVRPDPTIAGKLPHPPVADPVELRHLLRRDGLIVCHAPILPAKKKIIKRIAKKVLTSPIWVVRWGYVGQIPG